jgi:hypothetical protein
MAEAYLAQSSRTAWRVYDGEAVVLCPDDSTLNTLNAVGTLIWESADGTTTVSAIVARICEEFDVDPERAERDTRAFIAKLRERGLLTVSETLQQVP